jgi:AmmeMemoRadiSam system protein A
MTDAVGNVPGAYLAEEERMALLGIARRAVEGYVRGKKVPAEAGAPGKLSAPGAAFVTLTKRGRLRGCIGYTEAVAPLCKVVQECAVAAATEDPRFPPVSPAELPSIRLEISVLTPLFPIRPEDVEVGRHGLMVTQGRMRGLLLPQVPVEWGWDREMFLEQACVKAGLPPSAWRHGATVQGFTAEVFGEGVEESARPL